MLTTVGLFGDGYSDLDFRSGSAVVGYEISSGFVLYIIAMLCTCGAITCAVLNIVKNKEAEAPTENLEATSTPDADAPIPSSSPSLVTPEQ